MPRIDPSCLPRSSRARRAVCLLGILLSAWPGILSPLANAQEFPAVEMPSSVVELNWQTNLNRVQARLVNADLRAVLEKVAQATGWQVFLEPAIQEIVNTKFSDHTPGKALDYILGNLNRVLLPPTNGAPRLLVFRSRQEQATEAILVEPPLPLPPKPIPNELIVTVKPGTDIDALAKLLGGKVTGRLPQLNIYQLTFQDAESAEAARRLLEGRDEVVSVDHNLPIRQTPPARLAQGGVEGMDLNFKPPTPSDGNYVVVGLLDTPLDTSQPWVKDFLLDSFSVTGDGCHPGTLQHADEMFQNMLHGNSMWAGDPNSAMRVVHVDVYGCQAEATTFSVTMGLYRLLQRGDVHVINMSLGSYTEAPYMRRVIQAGYEQGIRFVAAAGNDPVTISTSPAGWDEVLSVTAGNRSGMILPFANRAPTVDAVGPGADNVWYNGQRYIVGGTSVSSAFSSGYIARLMQRQGISAAQAMDFYRLNFPVNFSPVNSGK